MNLHIPHLAIPLLAALTLYSGCIAEDFPDGRPLTLDSGGGDVSDASGDVSGPPEDTRHDSGGDVGDDADARDLECESDEECEDGPNQIGTCEMSSNTCSLTCKVGFKDCDGDDTNGCEANFGTLDHCGGCGIQCSPEGKNYAPQCNGGVCEVDEGTCALGYEDRDEDPGNGCECGPDDVPDADGEDTNCDGVDGILDGEDANVVFVAPDGNDTDEGLSPGRALRSLQAAIDLAEDKGRAYVLAAGGSYKEVIELKDGVSLYGGYEDGDSWVRATGSRETIIEPDQQAVASQTEHFKSVIADGLTEPVVLDHVTIKGVDAPEPGSSTYGLWIHACDDLSVQNSHIIAGVGSDGVEGVPGITREDASCNAAGGSGGAQNTSTLQCPNPGKAETGTPGDDGTQSGSGGRGGDPGDHFCQGTLPSCSPTDGEGGAVLDGEDGLPGSNGTTGTPHGEVASGHWSADAVSAPSDGGDGGGGGGGGAGGDCESLSTSRGGAGGHGGAGGCGATNGTNGTPGGGSFGIFIASSTVDVDSVTVVRNNGGRGGDGGDGGTGQQAPDTGWSEGEDGQTGAADGGDGGYGGDGGDGGAGAGGCGGPSMGIAWDASTVNVTNPTYDGPSQGAQGGTGGAHQDPQTDDAPDGCTGAVSNEHTFNSAPSQ